MEICCHPAVWITGSHGLKRETLLLGRQQDTPDLCICFKEISPSNIFRVCSLEMAKRIGKGDQESQDLGMVLGLQWADGLKTAPGTASCHTKLSEGLVTPCLWIAILM